MKIIKKIQKDQITKTNKNKTTKHILKVTDTNMLNN